MAEEVKVSKSALKKLAKAEKKLAQKQARGVVPVKAEEVKVVDIITEWLPSGVRDFNPSEMILRNKMLATIREVFTLHGGQEIDTPVFERREILAQKYSSGLPTKDGVSGVSGETFDLVGRDGQELSMRPDLTVPLSRYMAMNGLLQFRRMQFGKVYRREKGSTVQSRYTEFTLRPRFLW